MEDPLLGKLCHFMSYNFWSISVVLAMICGCRNWLNWRKSTQCIYIYTYGTGWMKVVCCVITDHFLIRKLWEPSLTSYSINYFHDQIIYHTWQAHHIIIRSVFLIVQQWTWLFELGMHVLGYPNYFHRVSRHWWPLKLNGTSYFLSSLFCIGEVVYLVYGMLLYIAWFKL